VPQGKLPFNDMMTTYARQLYGVTVDSVLQCRTCGLTRHTTPNVLLELNCTIAKSRTIEDSLKEYFEPTFVESVECENCKSNQPTDKLDRIVRPPNYLILCLKRSLANGNKDDSQMKIPSNLSLGQYMPDTFEGNSNIYASPDADSYSCYAGVIHAGTPTSGHFVAVCKVPNGQFYMFNDSHVTQLSEADAMVQLGRAQILFFKRNEPVPYPSEFDPMSKNVDSVTNDLPDFFPGEEEDSIKLYAELSENPFPDGLTPSTAAGSDSGISLPLIELDECVLEKRIQENTFMQQRRLVEKDEVFIQKNIGVQNKNKREPNRKGIWARFKMCCCKNRKTRNPAVFPIA